MIPLETVFLGFVVLFAIIGALRGWAKELLVSFSVVLARFIEFVAVNYVPVLSGSFKGLSDTQPKTWFLVRLAIFGVLVSFGYATTVLSSRLNVKARKEKFQDTLLGLFLGIINGYLVMGMVWGFIDQLGYNVWGITGPQTASALGFLKYLPIGVLEGPTLFVAVAVAFAFVLIVFV